MGLLELLVMMLLGYLVETQKCKSTWGRRDCRRDGRSSLALTSARKEPESGCRCGYNSFSRLFSEQSSPDFSNTFDGMTHLRKMAKIFLPKTLSPLGL